MLYVLPHCLQNIFFFNNSNLFQRYTHTRSYFVFHRVSFTPVTCLGRERHHWNVVWSGLKTIESVKSLVVVVDFDEFVKNSQDDRLTSWSWALNECIVVWQLRKLHWMSRKHRRDDRERVRKYFFWLVWKLTSFVNSLHSVKWSTELN